MMRVKLKWTGSLCPALQHERDVPRRAGRGTLRGRRRARHLSDRPGLRAAAQPAQPVPGSARQILLAPSQDAIAPTKKRGLKIRVDDEAGNGPGTHSTREQGFPNASS